MSDQTNKKAPNNRGDSKIKALLRTLWLGLKDDVRTFTGVSLPICKKCLRDNIATNS